MFNILVVLTVEDTEELAVRKGVYHKSGIELD